MINEAVSNINLANPPQLEQKIKTVTCPEEQTEKANTLFLAGGISNCPDWQQDLIKIIYDHPITVLNPRRLSFDVSDPTATDFQIAWEHRHLNLAESISFWFPKETECPITLFELGYWLLTDKPLVIGVHPEYSRIQELFAHLSIHRPELKILGTLPELANGIRKLSVERFETPQYLVNSEKVFIAGGISNCPDWQAYATKLLEAKDISVFNPRNKEFNGKGGIGYREHLKKNHHDLISSKAVAFWFPKNTFCSMALFELGIACQLNKPLFIGVEPGYPREQDILVQVGLARPEVEVVFSIEDLVRKIN